MTRHPLAPARPADFLDVTRAAVMPPAAALQDAWARAAEARGIALRLDRLRPSYLVASPVEVAPARPHAAGADPAAFDQTDTFRRIGQITPRGIAAMSPEAAARMRARIAQLHGDEDPKGAA